MVPLVLEHRVLSKLKSTYVDALPQLVEAETGRVHTDFNQAVTATGRLSSSNPNLQNIPVRTEYSRRIRKAFLPQEGWTLISADYSQIELRILTHLSGEDVLQEAYRSGDDVHALTARLLLEKDEISSDERRLGKTINFGVIYGMGAQRFARETGVSQAEAKEFLTKYKQRYPRVFAFLELQERLALSRGYVETILGRRQCSDPGFQRRHHQGGDGAASGGAAEPGTAGAAAVAGARRTGAGSGAGRVGSHPQPGGDHHGKRRAAQCSSGGGNRGRRQLDGSEIGPAGNAVTSASALEQLCRCGSPTPSPAARSRSHR